MFEFLKNVNVLLIDGIEGDTRIRNNEMFAYSKWVVFSNENSCEQDNINLHRFLRIKTSWVLQGPIASILKTTFLPFEIICKKETLKDLATTKLEKENKELAKIFKTATENFRWRKDQKNRRN